MSAEKIFYDFFAIVRETTFLERRLLIRRLVSRLWFW